VSPKKNEGIPERTNRLLYVPKGSLKEYAQLWLEVIGKDTNLLGSKDTPTTDALKDAHKKHLAYIKRQFPELLHFTTESVV
jgi:hypothetical protein